MASIIIEVHPIFLEAPLTQGVPCLTPKIGFRKETNFFPMKNPMAQVYKKKRHFFFKRLAFRRFWVKLRNPPRRSENIFRREALAAYL